MIKTKLSIIVPIYNIEVYLPSCLDSILEQDYQDYELLLINDGSTDKSGEIADDYASKDNRIKVYHQINAGVSAARNLGIEKAKGEWICFVDGDDELYPNSLTAVLTETDKCEIEMIIAQSFIYERGQIKNEKYKFDQSFLNRTFDGYKLIIEKSYKRGSVWGCIFKSDFLKMNQLNFPLGLKIGEDSIFISIVHLYVQHISFIDQTFYLVNERQGSTSRSWSFEKVYKMKDNIQFISNYIEKNPNLNKMQIQILHYSIYGAVSSIFNYLYYCFSIRNYLKILKDVRRELGGSLDTGNIPISKGKVKLLNFSLTWFSFSVLINQNYRQLFK